MIQNSIKAIFTFLSTVVVLYGAPANHFNVINGDQEEKYEKEFLPSLEDATGFSLSDPHEKIDDIYAKYYGNPNNTTYDKDWIMNLDNLGFFSVSNDLALYNILKSSPQIAGFQPFNLHIYKLRDENITYIGHIDPRTMLDITGVKNKKDRTAYIKMFKPLDNYVTKEFAGKILNTTFDKLPSKTMMNFEFEVDRSADVVEWAELFQEKFEAAFEKKQYIITGFKNFKEIYEEDLDMPFDTYDQFFVYSLCHFTFSYNIFNKGRPDAGVFAPCVIYFYIKKGSDKMEVGMPSLAVWAAVMNIKDPIKLEWINKIDKEMVNIMNSLGAKEI